MKKLLITANLITLNEAHNIRACLDSLRWVDDIVVVDGGSQDGTVEIARTAGARVIQHDFDDFAAQRNRALDASRGDWIISVDADERIPKKLADEVIARIQRESEAEAFWVPIQSQIFGRQFRYSGTQGERKLRLFQRQAAQWQGAVHEIPRISTGRIGQLLTPILHESTPNLEVYLSKLNRYSSLEADRMERPPGVFKRCSAPLWTFIKLYFAKRGFLDGSEGFRFCALSALQVWMIHRIALERFKNKDVPHEVAIGTT